SPPDDLRFVRHPHGREGRRREPADAPALRRLHEEQYDCAVVISNDSDPVAPIRIVKERLGRKIGLINPHKHPSKTLKPCATFFKQIRERALAQSQFPPLMSDAVGPFTKPPGW